jgi:transketolase
MAKQDPRKVFEKAFLEIGKENDKVVGISCDSAKGAGMWSFVEAFPERYVEVGISEQNAIGIAAGLSQQGFIPVVIAINPFVTMRCYEQVRDDVGYVNLNVKIVGSGGGLAYSTLGSTHETIEDIAVMRTIPHLTIFTPCDGYEVEQALRKAIEIDGPVYIRMPRQAREDIADPATRNFVPGKAEVFEGGNDVAILAAGPLVNESREAAKILESKGIHATVADFMTVKPLDTKTVEELYSKTKMLVTVEEHCDCGGLGTAVAETVCSIRSDKPLYRFGVPEGAKEVGPYEEVLDHYGLSAEKIASKTEELFRAL